jgi:hypothetical protein
LASGLLFGATLGEDSFGSFIGCHGLSCLDVPFFVIHALLFFVVLLFVIVEVVLVLLLLEEFKLFEGGVEVVDVSDGAVEEAVFTLGFAPCVIGCRILECHKMGLASFELFLYQGEHFEDRFVTIEVRRCQQDVHLWCRGVFIPSRRCGVGNHYDVLCGFSQELVFRRWREVVLHFHQDGGSWGDRARARAHVGAQQVGALLGMGGSFLACGT